MAADSDIYGLTEGSGISAMTDWISVADEMPESLETVLFSNGCRVFCGYYGEETPIWFEHQFGLDKGVNGVTHWMPMPNPPVSE